MIIITGATSSIGHALARELAKGGHDLILCARNKVKLEPVVKDIQARYGVKCLGSLFDAMDINKHEGLLKKMKDHPVKGIVLAHGYIEGEDGLNTIPGDLDKLVKVNYESIMSLLSAYARYFKGFACVITSVSGDRGKARNLVYNSAKAAASVYLQGFVQAAPHVRLIEVKPGFVDTPMTYGSVDSILVASREKVARDIVKAIRKGKRLVYTPWFWRYIMFILRNMPDFVFNRLKL
ncbi:MAG: SDR family NAD(P)-dependent oxidoreductase [Candidatus Nanoarchaeia archaeon]